jgi:hypothetical protein
MDSEGGLPGMGIGGPAIIFAFPRLSSLPGWAGAQRRRDDAQGNRVNWVVLAFLVVRGNG